MSRRGLLVVALIITAALPSAALARKRAAAPPPASLDAATINAAVPGGRTARGVDPLAIRAAVLLDRAGFSPGVIDGRWGGNLAEALKHFQAARKLTASGQLDEPTWQALSATDTAAVVTEHPVTPADVKGPFLDKIPPRLEAMRGLKSLAYTGPRELLAERYHMSEALLAALNPGRHPAQAGTSLLVAEVARPSRNQKAARVTVEKGRRVVEAFGADGTLLASYPASIGSTEKPAPSGRLDVKAVAENPTYTYNPDYAFRGVRTKEKFDIAGGPNNPVGSVWIALSREGYGIHGTPDPERVGKSYSHGCIRLTNWDAHDLARLVTRGTPVEFND